MRLFFFSNVSGHIRPPVLIALILIAMPIRFSIAENLLGLYVGAAAGQSQVEGTAPYNLHFRENHSAFKLMVGLRPISLVGVEIAYIDFGHLNRWTSSLIRSGAIVRTAVIRDPLRPFDGSEAWVTEFRR
jgi:hypothetical protein